MKLHELSKPIGSTKNTKRKGRGTATGQGKTGGRLGFEGGQMPLYRRIPKRGFTNVFKKEWSIMNVSDLNCYEDGTEITPELLAKEGKVKQVKAGVKILGEGNLEKKLTVKANKFSKAAIEKIEAAGGKAEVI